MEYVFIIIVTILSIYERKEIFNKMIFKKPFKLRAWFIILLIFISTSLGIKKIYDDNFNRKYETNYGSINSYKIRKPIFFKTSEKNIEISNGVFDLSEFDPVNFGNNVLRVWIENNNIKVDVDIKNEDGYLICQIKNGEWKLNEGAYFDRNFDDNALEIRDIRNGNIVLQIDLSNQNTICIQAVLPSTDSTVTLIQGCDVPIMTLMSILNTDHAVDKLLKTMPIIPIFKYPSGLNKGVRETNRLNHPFKIKIDSLKSLEN